MKGLQDEILSLRFIIEEQEKALKEAQRATGSGNFPQQQQPYRETLTQPMQSVPQGWERDTRTEAERAARSDNFSQQQPYREMYDLQNELSQPMTNFASPPPQPRLSQQNFTHSSGNNFPSSQPRPMALPSQQNYPPSSYQPPANPSSSPPPPFRASQGGGPGMAPPGGPAVFRSSGQGKFTPR